MKKLTREQLIRRLTIIEDDVTRLYELLGLMGVNTSDTSTKHGVSVDTYVTNIEIACGVDASGIPTDSDGFRVETEWLTKSEIEAKKISDKKAKYDKIIAELKEDEVDGEMMQYIIEEIGMGDQMLRQLILTNPQSDTYDLLEEHKSLEPNDVIFPSKYIDLK